MSAGLLMAEKMLMPLAIEMLQFSQRLQRGCWENWDIEAAQHLLNAVQRMDVALELIIHNDGIERDLPPLTFQ